jgi:hypothetical protein
MIYLIDDKIIRQEKDYKWTSNRFVHFKKYIQPIYSLESIESSRSVIFKEGNIILYHESFLDASEIQDEASERRNKLNDFAKDENSWLVYFSGSYSSRDISGNIVHMPVSVLYNNLEVFVSKYSVGDFNINYLLFGGNPNLDEELLSKLTEAVYDADSEVASETNNSILFLQPSKHFISEPIRSCTKEKIYNLSLDEEFASAALEYFDKTIYQDIFIPLCFGKSMSDFNGLRLACHLRFTQVKNQFTRVFIYGPVGKEFLIENECFDILKTRNTYLIPISKSAIYDATCKLRINYGIEELKEDVSLVRFNLPSHYYDNHAVANEWGIYQMARNAGIDINEIAGFDCKKLLNLYFKWLIVKNGLNEPLSTEQEKAQVKYAKKLNGLKILGKIDLSKFQRK